MASPGAAAVLRWLAAGRLPGWVQLMGALLLLWAPPADANLDAKRLYDDLLSNYNRLIRPVGNNSDRLTVRMGLRLSQLIEVVSLRCCAFLTLSFTWPS